MNLNSLRLKISEAIESRQLNCSVIEKKTGLPRAALRNFINGTVKGPKLEVIMAAANFLEINLNELPDTNKQLEENINNVAGALSCDATNYELLNLCLRSMYEITRKKTVSHSLEQSLTLLEKIYNFCYTYNNQKIDESFVGWCMDNP